MNQAAKDHLRDREIMLAHGLFKRQRKAYELRARQQGVCHSCTSEEVVEAIGLAG